MYITKTLKVAQPDDITKITALIKEFYDMSPFTGLTFSEARVVDQLQRITVDPHNYICLLSMDGDEAVGLIVGMKVMPSFSEELVSCELAWYVKPEHRKSRRGLELLRAYEEWSKQVGCKFAQFALLMSDQLDPETVEKIYNIRGYRKTEQGFQKAL